MTTDTNYEPQNWTYVGRRRGSKNLVRAWLDHNGVERWFGKLPGSVIGGIYTVNCIATDDDGVSVRGVPAWTGDRSNHDNQAMWELEDRSAYTADQLAKRERKAGAEDLMGDLTLREIREKLSRQFGSNRSVMLAQVLRYIGG